MRVLKPDRVKKEKIKTSTLKGDSSLRARGGKKK
jgi:hypothetical protein